MVDDQNYNNSSSFDSDNNPNSSWGNSDVPIGSDDALNARYFNNSDNPGSSRNKADDDWVNDIDPSDYEYQKSGELPDYSSPDTYQNYQQSNQQQSQESYFDDSEYTQGNFNTNQNLDFDPNDYNPPNSQSAIPPNQNGYNTFDEPETQRPKNNKKVGKNPISFGKSNQQSQRRQPPGRNIDSDYIDDEEEIPENNNNNKIQLTNRQIKAAINTFASRGTSILVTGCGGCGTSTIAYHLANTICNIGFNVLLVDMDTINKTQSYISKDNYECVQFDGAGVMAAVNTINGINTNLDVVRQGFHLLTMGMGSDSRKPSEAFKLDRLGKFVSQAKNSHHFVVYDVPFQYAVNELSPITLGVDDLVLTVDSSNWGIAKTLINICNIESDDLVDTVFGRGQLLFNRYHNLSKVFGSRVRKLTDITKLMDKKVLDLVGQVTGYYFSSMKICGVVKESPNFETGWFNNVQFSDTPNGFDIFSKLLQNILIHSM